MSKRLWLMALALIVGTAVYVPAELIAAKQPRDANSCTANCPYGSCGASGSGCVCFCWGPNDNLPRCSCDG